MDPGGRVAVLFILGLLQQVHSCHIGTASECDKAPFIPGHNLAGEGFDVVRMHRMGANVIDVKTYLSDNDTCTLCTNRFQQGQIQRLPAAVLDWRPFSRCSKQLSSALHHSVDSLLRGSNSLINNNWELGLSLGYVGKAVLSGSHSDLANFARSEDSADKATFSLQETSCTYYSYRLTDHPQLSTEFAKHLKTLPPSLNTNQSKALYRRLIETYGTHYIHQVKLGGKVRKVTAFRTCLATLKGFSESEINNCMNVELSILLGFETSSSSSNCNNLKGNMGMSMGFSHGFMTHNFEVTGGERYFPDNVHQQDSAKAYHRWMNSLQENPDVVSSTIFPLHNLVEDMQISANLKSVITEYIKENQLQETQFGSKNCYPTSNLDQNCCPRQLGRGTLKLQIIRAAGLNSDPTSETDAYVKIFCSGMYKKTHFVLDNNNPEWDVNFYFGSVDISQYLWLEVWDKDMIYDDLVGECSTSLERGTHSLSCEFETGTLYYTYTVECDSHLTGFKCGKYSPNEGRVRGYKDWAQLFPIFFF